MELYVHIPFCVRKCNYCDFLSMPADHTVRERYVQALKNELSFYADSIADRDRKLQTIYFGGGTPSVLSPGQLEELLSMVYKLYDVDKDAEITIEINPATIDYDGLHKIKEAGFNRLSIGLQSANDEELKLLGRIHTYEQFLDTYHNARKAGFANINIDCMSSLPGQRLDTYIDSLHKIVNLQPEHISSYSLILEKGTPFYQRFHDHPEKYFDEDLDRQMYHETKRILKENGYERYEISNYAKNGFESRHNSGYWTRIPYLGVGLGASSFLFGKRTKNMDDMEHYLSYWTEQKKNMSDLGNQMAYCSFLMPDETLWCGEKTARDTERYCEVETVTAEDAMAEYFFLGLRMSKGASIRGFEKEFGISVYERYGQELELCQKEKLLTVDPFADRIALTDFGMDVSNWVFEKFV